MIQISTLITNNIEQLLASSTNDFLVDIQLQNFEEKTVEEKTQIVNSASAVLPNLQETPSLACIDAIMAFSKQTASA